MIKNSVIILGAKKLAHIAVDIFVKNKVNIYGLLEDDKSLYGNEINSIPVLGETTNEQFLQLIGNECDVFVANDNKEARKYLLNLLIKKKIMPVNAIDLTANIASSASFGYGNLIMGQVSMLPLVHIGQHNIIYNGVILGTGSKVKDNVIIGQRVSIGHEVTIEDGAFIGDGAVLIDGISIAKNASIGAGSVVVSSVEKNQQVFGNPAKNVINRRI